MKKIDNLSNIQFQKKLSPHKNKYANVPKEYLKIAEGMETQFINHMMNEMQKTVKSEKPDSNAEKYYKSLLSNERAKIMAATDNGIGLKEIILDQIVPQHLKASSSADAVKMYKKNTNIVQGDNDE